MNLNNTRKAVSNGVALDNNAVSENLVAHDRTLTASETYRSILQDYPDVLDVNHVGAILGVSTKTVYRLLNEGALVYLKVGRAFKIPKLYVLQYIKVLARAEG